MANAIRRAEALTRDLRELYGEALLSVVLYGSAARGEYREGTSDLNLLVLLRDAGPAMLRRASGRVAEWAGAGNPPPLVMGRDEWERSADVFAIEYADIGDAHVTLVGEDPFDGVTVRPEDLRHQCERELKGKHIQLRERYLLLAERPEELAAVFVRSLSTFLVMFRTVLRLSAAAVPRDHEAVVRETAERAGFDPAPVLKLLAARAAGGAPRLERDDPVIIGYLEAVGRVVHYIDRMMEEAP